MMEKRRKLNKSIAMMLILTIGIMMMPLLEVHADSSENTQIINVSNDSVMIAQDGGTSKISWEKNETGKLSRVIVENEITGKVNYFTINDGKVTSSITGQTVNMQAENEIKPFATGDISYKYISFASIKKLVGVSGGLAEVVGAIIALCGVSITNPVAGVLMLAGALAGLVSEAMEGSPTKGVKVKLKETLRRSTKNGKGYTYKSYEIVGLSRY